MTLGLGPARPGTGSRRDMDAASHFSLGFIRESQEQHPPFPWDCLGRARSSRGEAAAQGDGQTPAWSTQTSRRDSPVPPPGATLITQWKIQIFKRVLGIWKQLERASHPWRASLELPSRAGHPAAPGHLHPSFPGSRTAPSRAGSRLDPGWIHPDSLARQHLGLRAPRA